MATRQAAEPLGYCVMAIDQAGSSHFSLRFDAPVQSSRNLVGGNAAAPQKAGKFFHSCLFLASALRGLSSIYAIYRGRGWVWGWFLVWFWGWRRGLSPAGYFLRLGNSSSTPASSWLQSGPVELIPEKTRLEANRFRRTAWPREMLARTLSRFSLQATG